MTRLYMWKITARQTLQRINARAIKGTEEEEEKNIILDLQKFHFPKNHLNQCVLVWELP